MSDEHHRCHVCVKVGSLKPREQRIYPKFGNRKEDDIWENISYFGHLKTRDTQVKFNIHVNTLQRKITFDLRKVQYKNGLKK